VKKAKTQLSPRAQLALAAAVPLVLIAAGWLLLVGPQRSKAADVASQREAAETQLVQLQAEAAHAPKPEPIRVADIFRLIKAMPDREDMPGIILQLNDVAAESGISFNSIVPEAVGPAVNGYQTRRVQLSFSGNFYGLSDFLYRLRSLVGVRGGQLEADGRLFTVESLSFAEGKPSFPQIDATLTLDAYVYGSGAVATPPPPPAATTTTTTTTTDDAAASPTAAGAGTGETG
jgi:Tfp pilus assembly protein PilO